MIYSRSLHSSHPANPSLTQILPYVTSSFGKLFYSFRFIIHQWWFYYSYYNLLMYYLFVNRVCLTLPAASGGHGWKIGGWAGCSSGCHWGPKVAPPDGQCGKDGCGHPWRSRGEKPVLSQADIHIGWTLNFLFKEKTQNCVSIDSLFFHMKFVSYKKKKRNCFEQSQASALCIVTNPVTASSLF